MNKRLAFTVLVLSYLAVILPFTAYLKNRPVAIKLGYLPDADIIKAVSGSQRYLMGELSIVKVLFYFGSLIDKLSNKTVIPPEYYNMFKMLETGVKLDPHNKDAYYFAQAVFTWEIGRAADVNKLLIYGMKYRTWDDELPFYAAFNYAYFMKDYQNSSLYMKKAAEISRDPLYAVLAARYFNEAGKDELGISFLDAMEKGTEDKRVRELYRLRKKALIAVNTLNEAVNKFNAAHKRAPAGLRELVTAGILSAIPADPYGGQFYIDDNDKIRSTSKFIVKDAAQ